MIKSPELSHQISNSLPLGFLKISQWIFLVIKETMGNFGLYGIFPAAMKSALLALTNEKFCLNSYFLTFVNEMYNLHNVGCEKCITVFWSLIKEEINLDAIIVRFISRLNFLVLPTKYDKESKEVTFI